MRNGDLKNRKSNLSPTIDGSLPKKRSLPTNREKENQLAMEIKKMNDSLHFLPLPSPHRSAQGTSTRKRKEDEGKQTKASSLPLKSLERNA